MIKFIADYLFVYLGIMSVISFAAFGIDKKKAQKHKWRIPEKTLITLTLAGGVVGSWLGMWIFHHKTKHPKFYAAAIIGALLWAALCVWLWYCQ